MTMWNAGVAAIRDPSIEPSWVWGGESASKPRASADAAWRSSLRWCAKPIPGLRCYTAACRSYGPVVAAPARHLPAWAGPEIVTRSCVVQRVSSSHVGAAGSTEAQRSRGLISREITGRAALQHPCAGVVGPAPSPAPGGETNRLVAFALREVAVAPRHPAHPELSSVRARYRLKCAPHQAQRPGDRRRSGPMRPV